MDKDDRKQIFEHTGEVTRPDDNFVDATDSQTVLLGQFNRLYGKTGAAPIAPSYRGRVGFIVE